MEKSRIKIGDNVKILIGKDNGKSGIVESVNPTMKKVVVKGINMYKKHVKPSKKYPSGGIIDINMPLNISNVIIICPNCGKTTKAKFNLDKSAKTRICKKCGKSLENGAK